MNARNAGSVRTNLLSLGLAVADLLVAEPGPALSQ